MIINMNLSVIMIGTNILNLNYYIDQVVDLGKKGKIIE